MATIGGDVTKPHPVPALDELIATSAANRITLVETPHRPPVKDGPTVVRPAERDPAPPRR
jgi:hypothetical protein